MPASSTASLTMVETSAGVRLGSLRFTKERMRWMIWPARCACLRGLVERREQRVRIDLLAL